MFFLHRIRSRRKRIAALALLPFAAFAASNALATAPTTSAVALKLGDKNVLAGGKVKITGTVTPGGSHTVEIDVNGRRVKELRSDSDGGFHGWWGPETPGVYKLEAIVKGDGVAPLSSGHKRLNAYRAVQASYYGPGLYGNHVACGGVLTPKKLGVANKTLPCGTRVTLRHGGTSVTVPVIDRGPYAGNRVYDLTTATKNKLGFGGIGTVLATK